MQHSNIKTSRDTADSQSVATKYPCLKHCYTANNRRVLTYTEAAAVADATLAKAEPMPQSPAPTALAAAADVTSAVNAVEFATARAQEDPARCRSDLEDRGKCLHSRST